LSSERNSRIHSLEESSSSAAAAAAAAVTAAGAAGKHRGQRHSVSGRTGSPGPASLGEISEKIYRAVKDSLQDMKRRRRSNAKGEITNLSQNSFFHFKLSA
jgi:hypothetical protein